MQYLECKEIIMSFFIGLVKQTEQQAGETSHIILDLSNILNLSTYYYMKGESKKSLEILDWGMSIFKDTDRLKIEKCKILILNQKYYRAKQVLDSLLHPECHEALYEKAKIAILQNDTKLSNFYLKEIINTGGSRDQLLIELTFFLSTNHKMYFAKECWEKVSKDVVHTYDYKLSALALEYELGQYDTAYMHSVLLFKQYPKDIASCFYCTDLTFKLSGIRSIRSMTAHCKKIHATSTFVQHIEQSLETLLSQRPSRQKRGNQ